MAQTASCAAVDGDSRTSQMHRQIRPRDLSEHEDEFMSSEVTRACVLTPQDCGNRTYTVSSQYRCCLIHSLQKHSRITSENQFSHSSVQRQKPLVQEEFEDDEFEDDKSQEDEFENDEEDEFEEDDSVQHCASDDAKCHRDSSFSDEFEGSCSEDEGAGPTGHEQQLLDLTLPQNAPAGLHGSEDEFESCSEDEFESDEQ